MIKQILALVVLALPAQATIQNETASGCYQAKNIGQTASARGTKAGNERSYRS